MIQVMTIARCCLMIFTTSIIFLCSCRKNDNNTHVNHTNIRVKTVAENNKVTWYYYDDKHRIVQVKRNDTLVEDYSYEPDKIIKRNFYEGWVDTSVYATDGHGHIKKLTRKYDVFYEVSSSGLPLRAYNNLAQGNETLYYYNSDSTLLDSIRSTQNGLWGGTGVYTWYVDKYNTLKNENFGQKFMGDYELKPIAKRTFRYPDNGILKEDVYEFTYEYDANGRIVKWRTMFNQENYDILITYY